MSGNIDAVARRQALKLLERVLALEKAVLTLQSVKNGLSVAQGDPAEE